MKLQLPGSEMNFQALWRLVKSYGAGYKQIAIAIPMTILRGFFFLLVCFEVASVLEVLNSLMCLQCCSQKIVLELFLPKSEGLTAQKTRMFQKILRIHKQFCTALLRTVLSFSIVVVKAICPIGQQMCVKTKFGPQR